MSRPRLLTPLLALLLACTGGGETTTTGFESGPATTGGPGPSSFGDSSTGTGATTGQVPTTGEPATTGELATTDEPTTTATTTADPGTTASSSTSTTADTTADASTTGAASSCGDGILDADEFCDDGNQVDADACLSDCHPGTALLALVGQASDPGVALSFDPELGWTADPAPMALLSAEIEATPTGALAVLRRSSALKSEHEALHSAAWSPGDPAPFASFTAVGTSFTADRPSLAAVAETVTLGYLGLDNKHFSALHTDNGWAAPVKIPAGQLDIQAFGPSGPLVVPGTVETYAVYTGDDARIYYSMKSSPGGAWSASTATPPASVLGRPVGVVDPASDLVLAYVRKSDGKLAVIKLLTPQNAWTKEVVVHPQAITGGDISLARLDDGRYALAWRGFDTQGIYLSLADDFDAWAAPQTVEVPPATTTPPLLVPGATGADLEILYTAGGKLRHVRMLGTQLGDPTDVPGVTKAATVAAARVQLAPG
jgi:cysteine-rich repeat protein